MWLKGGATQRLLPHMKGPLTVRRRKSDLHARVNRNLPLEFDDVRLTSYAGLELLERYLRTRRFNQLVREAFADLPRWGDFGVVVMVRVFVGLVIVGGRRLRHLAYVADDPIFQRFGNVRVVPTARRAARSITASHAAPFPPPCPSGAVPWAGSRPRCTRGSPPGSRNAGRSRPRSGNSSPDRQEGGPSMTPRHTTPAPLAHGGVRAVGHGRRRGARRMRMTVTGRGDVHPVPQRKGC